jgi:hypothetical protein
MITAVLRGLNRFLIKTGDPDAALAEFGPNQTKIKSRHQVGPFASSLLSISNAIGPGVAGCVSNGSRWREEAH